MGIAGGGGAGRAGRRRQMSRVTPCGRRATVGIAGGEVFDGALETAKSQVMIAALTLEFRAARWGSLLARLAKASRSNIARIVAKLRETIFWAAGGGFGGGGFFRIFRTVSPDCHSGLSLWQHLCQQLRGGGSAPTRKRRIRRAPVRGVRFRARPPNYPPLKTPRHPRDGKVF